MMRVLYIHAGNWYGGIESMAVAMARHAHLCKAMEAHFAVCFEGRLSRELETAGAPVSLLGDVRISRPVSVSRARRKLKALLGSEHFELVITSSAWSQALFGGLVKAAKLPLVYWFHEPMRGRHWLERWARMIVPDLALCNSRYTAGTIANMYPGVRTALLYNPVQLVDSHLCASEREFVRAQLGTPEKSVVIIQVSRMASLKGHGLHLEALSRLTDIPDWTCWIVGGAQHSHEARYLNELKEKAASYGLSGRVRFLGERTDVDQLLLSADIYCQPNTGAESFGNTFIEAMFAGLPVVTTDMGGAQEIVDDTCGILVPPCDPEALANTLRSLILDETRRATLGAAAPVRAHQLCDLSRQMETLVEIFAGVARRDSIREAEVTAQAFAGR